jgi:hypothetical protein
VIVLRVVLRVVMTGAACASLGGTVGCVERTPSELRPGFDALIDLAFNICTEEGTGPVQLLLRNIGDDEVTIASVAFVADPDQPDAVTSFDEPTVDNTSLLAEAEAFVQFTYRVPGGLAQKATLVISSDAEVNPELSIPVVTQELVVDNKEEICGTP